MERQDFFLLFPNDNLHLDGAAELFLYQYDKGLTGSFDPTALTLALN